MFEWAFRAQGAVQRPCGGRKPSSAEEFSEARTRVGMMGAGEFLRAWVCLGRFWFLFSNFAKIYIERSLVPVTQLLPMVIAYVTVA